MYEMKKSRGTHRVFKAVKLAIDAGILPLN
jgi:hypothetical protein